jgi:hypothetical protein
MVNEGDSCELCTVPLAALTDWVSRLEQARAAREGGRWIRLAAKDCSESSDWGADEEGGERRDSGRRERHVDSASDTCNWQPREGGTGGQRGDSKEEEEEGGGGSDGW